MRRIQYASAGLVLVGAAITRVCYDATNPAVALLWTIPICVAAVICVWHIERGVREERADANPIARFARQLTASINATRSTQANLENGADQ